MDATSEPDYDTPGTAPDMVGATLSEDRAIAGILDAAGHYPAARRILRKGQACALHRRAT